MSYTTNPNMPKVRRDAAQMVYKGYSKAEVGRRFGVGSSTICKWVKKAEKYGYYPIPTLSSRPRHHPKELPSDLVWKIFGQRVKSKRCAEVVHQELKNDGVEVSLSSVKRVLDRAGLTKKRSPWKRYHPHVDRPLPKNPGDLVEMDTIHLMVDKKKRIYVFVLIDVYSRWVYVKAYEHMNSLQMLRFVREAQRAAPFHFSMLQSDHGPEFGKLFVSRIKKDHRFTRIGKPNDNAHVERFNRTIQEECLDRVDSNVPVLNKAIKKYVHYYNHTRLHMGIAFLAPIQLINRVQAID